jgi:hypothetical protein
VTGRSSSRRRLVTAKQYLTDPEFTGLRHAKVFNLCRHYRYQSLGYYVSLIAEARGHKPIPTVLTMQDLRSPALVRMASDEFDELIQRSLAPVTGDRWTLHVYFGRAASKDHDRLATACSGSSPPPSSRRGSSRTEEWELDRLSAIPASAIPDEDGRRPSSARRPSSPAATGRRRRRGRRASTSPSCGTRRTRPWPSDQGAIDRFRGRRRASTSRPR